jgi:nucleoside 2-deoxyribosyltransferase
MKTSLKIYIIGALKNKRIPEFANTLSKEGFEPFADWFAPGEFADTNLREYARQRGWDYKQTLASKAAQFIFNFDKTHIDEADMGVMLWPAGKSGHLELGYLRGQGKPAYIFFDGEPDRIDVMHNFASNIFFSEAELLEELHKYKVTKEEIIYHG